MPHATPARISLALLLFLPALLLYGCAAGERAHEQTPMQNEMKHDRADQNTQTQRVISILDAFHAAAARADGAAYFDLFAPTGIFIGTDAGERWTVAEFKAYAEPYFSKGKGWVYTPRAGSRHVMFSSSGDVAWFDELLDSASYGTSRGTGVLVRHGSAWKIAQYALTFPIPNDLAKELTARIAAFERAAGKP